MELELCNVMKETEGIVKELEKIEAIDSPSAYTTHIDAYLMNWFTEKGFKSRELRKGGVIAELGGSGSPLILMAHADTLGAVVGGIKENGHLIIANVTYAAPNLEAQNCRVITDDDRVYEGTVQLTNPSVHVNGKYRETVRDFDTLEVVLDEIVKCKKDVEDLGIQIGDVITMDPHFVVTEKGFIKSRYLDDKASVAITLDLARMISEGTLKLNRKVYLLITMFEEYGQGGNCGIPEDVEDILCIDMGCVGEGMNCSEYQVSICRKDARNVYHRGMTQELIELAKKKDIDYAVDVYPHYSSDANIAINTGFDMRHALIGPGIYASHGYERTHVKALKAASDLIAAYIGE